MTKPLKLSCLLLAFSTLLMASSTLLIGDDKSLQLVSNFYQTPSALTTNAPLIAALTFAVCAALAIATTVLPRYRQLLGISLIVLSAVPLVTLFSANRWIDALGGFPAIGSGQGIIKYFALLAIGIWLLTNEQLSTRRQQLLLLMPVMLVLMWIGGMKFTEIEANGIEALVASSPLMSWMYQLWDVQTTSNIIGVYDLTAVLLLLLSVFIPKLFWPAVIMSWAVFATTQTFLFSWSAALATDTLLSSGGQFLIKDLWFVTNLILYYQVAQSQATNNQFARQHSNKQVS